jgi:hypothetical protein
VDQVGDHPFVGPRSLYRRTLFLKRVGWQSLWIVIGILYAVPVIQVAISNWPSNTPPVYDHHVPAVPDGYKLVTDPEVLAQLNRREQIEIIAIAFGSWIIPMAALYALGLAIAHIAAAFRPSAGEALHKAGETIAEGVVIPLVICALLAGIAGALSVLGYQAYTFLRFGEWPAMSVIAALHWADLRWAQSPQDWLGVHKILAKIPLSIAIFFCGLIPLLLFSSWEDRR